MNIKMLILLYVVIALVLSRLPYARVYVSHCYTLLNKMISVFLDGRMSNKIKLFKDGTGGTTSPSQSIFKINLITYAANTGTLLVSIGLFYLVMKGQYRLVVYLFIGVLLLALLLWIRNLFGVIWVLSLACLLAIPIYFHFNIAFMHISIFLASVVFSQSVLNAVQVCRESIQDSISPPQKSILTRAKMLFGFLIGIILLGQSLCGGLYIFKNFLS